MALKKIVVRCTGISPLLMNPMTEDTLDQLYGGASARKRKDTERPQKDVAAEKVIRDAEGNIGLPVEYLFSALVNAGRFVKYDAKKNISNATSTLIPSFMSIEEFFLPFADQKVEWKVDKRRGRLAASGVAVCIIRPRFEQWSFTVTIEINDTEIAEDKVKELFRYAGGAVGLGDFRPACKGPFGRFTVDEWKVVEVPLKKVA
jgi:hypothetical protein